jgi:hypothetical protein
VRLDACVRVADADGRAAGRPAAGPDTSPVTLAPVAHWPGVPAEQSGASALVVRYLRLLGPASAAEVAGWLSTTQTELRPVCRTG